MLGISEISSQRFQKSILIIQFLFLTAGLIITWSNPSTGYESSIYNSTPLVLWIALISSLIVGITIIILSVSNSHFGGSNLWKSGFLLIFLFYTIILGLFILRGYYLWNMSGDAATHLNYINQILQTGHIYEYNFYPITHIFLSEISIVTTLNLVFLHKIIPFFFGLLCVVFIYIFVRFLSSNQIEPVIAGIISCTFVYGWYLVLTPNMLANLMIPLVLFLMFKYLNDNNIAWGILFCVMLILYPAFHPVPAIFIGLVLITLWIPNTFRDLWNFFREKNRNILHLPEINLKVVIPFLILLVWFILWYSLFYIWGYTINQIYLTISAELGPSQITDMVNQASYAQIYGYNIIEIILKMYGGPMLLTILSVLSFFLVWKTISKEPKQENIFSLYGPCAMVYIIIPPLFLFNVGFGSLRFVFFTSVLGTVFAAYLLSYILIRNKDNKKRLISRLTNIIVVVLLVGLTLNGVLNLYPSPYNLTWTLQTTHSEVTGMTYFFDYRDVYIPISGITTSFWRYSELLQRPEKPSTQYFLIIGDSPPWHFGYDQNSSIASSYPQKTNFILTQKDILNYVDYFPEMAKFRFVPQDFERFKNDPAVSHFYSNGEFEIFTIKP